MRLLADHTASDRRLGVVESLLEAGRRPLALRLLTELARNAVLSQYASLKEFRDRNPGFGRVFAPVDPEVNAARRMKTFEAAARLGDPARAVGPRPSDQELMLLDDFGIRLRLRVLPAATREIVSLAAELSERLGGVPARVSARARRPADLLDQVRRMTTERPHRPARPDHRVGDVADAVGVRLTVADTAALDAAFELAELRFGDDRILKIENLYAQPSTRAPAHRAINMIISIETDGLPCAYELRLATERSALAADLDRSAVRGPRLGTDGSQRLAVQLAIEEAAALDQLENVERNDHER